MRKTTLGICSAIGVMFGLAASVQFSAAQDAPKPRSTISQSLTAPAYPQSRVDSAMIEFPLPKGDEAYGSIDGRKIHQYVVDLAQLGVRNRGTGNINPNYWGRIMGTPGDMEANQWMAEKFKSFGLSDVHIQPIELPPQWQPVSWNATMSVGGKTIQLQSAQPGYEANGLPSGGLELDAVYAGLGTEADFAGKDVRGKAVFVYSQFDLPNLGAVKRADEKGAAVVFEVSMLPGNMRYQSYPSGTKAPAFTLGNDDGTAARQMIETATANMTVKVKVSLEVRKVPNLKTGLVWGTLPGATDETIYITAHKDGWFYGSGDNAAGVADLMGLAEYYSKIPQAQRRRTIIFIGLDGHHNGSTGGVGRRWMVEHRETLFAKTALFINVEHPAKINTQVRPRYYPGDEIVWSDTQLPLEWYAGGKNRPELQKIAWNAFREFGVPLDLDPNPTPPAGDAGPFYRFVPAVDMGEYNNYFHTDWETPETVPWTALQSSTRAFAKLIDEVNKLPLDALQRPEEPAPKGRTAD